MDESKYQLAGEDDDSFHIAHPDGSTFQVAKSGLTGNLMDKISSLPSMKGFFGSGDTSPQDNPQGMDDQGGDAPQEDVDRSQPLKINVPGVTDTPQMGAQPQPGAVPLSGNAEFSGKPTNPTDDLLKGSVTDQYKQNLGQQIQGVQDTSQAKQKESQQVQKAYEQNLKQQEDVGKKFDQQRTDLQTQHDKLFKEVNEGKINPNRYWNSLGTGQKIGTAISIILGGIGSGLNGQKNMGIETLNNQINSDIESQKDNLNRKGTLLNMNMEKYRDLNTAEAATRLQMNTVLQAQIAKAAAQSGNKQALANGQMAIAQLKQQAIPFMQQVAMAGVQAQVLGAGGGNAGIPTSQEPLSLLHDKEYQSKRIVVGGRAFQASTPEDAKVLKDVQAEYEPVKKLVQELGELGPSALTPGSESNLRAHAIRARLTPMINKMHGLNRLSEEDIKVMQGQLKDPTSFRQLMNGGVMTSQFMKNLSDDVDSNYKTRLINYKGPSQYKSFKPIGK